MSIDSVLQLLDRVRTSLWFVPGIMALCALGLAGFTLLVDHTIPADWLDRLPLVYSGEPNGARAVLSTIATSMVTTAGVVFSMTIVSLQLASSQFGPRLLRTFLRDRGNQIVLGAFVGIFLYCILVLPAIDGTSRSAFVPRIAVSLGVALAAIGLGLLVYFIDHVAQSIHADAVIESVGAELDRTIESIFPEPLGEGADEPAEERPVATDGAPVCAARSGYLRFVSDDTLLEAASERSAVVVLETRPGRYVFEGDVLAHVSPAASCTDNTRRAIQGAFVVGAHRTALQDATFAFEQLAEMAVRALSPGINDPNTAIHCVDRIGAGLARLAGRRMPSPLRRDESGAIRIIARPLAMRDVLECTLEPIARCAEAHLLVWLRLIEVLGVVFARASRAEDRHTLRALGLRLAAEARERFEADEDRRRIDEAAAWAAG